MQDYANMDVMLVGTLEVDQILIQLGEIPFAIKGGTRRWSCDSCSWGKIG